MEKHLATLGILIILAPLVGSLLAGFFGKKIGRAGAHWVTIIGIALSLLFSCIVFKVIILDGATPLNQNIYTWGVSGAFTFHVGFLLDRLTAIMLLVVTSVSLMVHIYSIGYMEGDPGYQRFFCYMSLFTFSMLVLITGNNFLQLFFGWEGVGLVSYLLIGFWFKKDSANRGSMKAFIVNRVGDFGFILGIGAILKYFGTLEYTKIFAAAPALATATIQIFPGHSWSLMSVICILLFVGAMGKSAQMPLHIWLPESMEGPTPISALIHAATMVTAGVFMVTRMSPLFELSQTALTVVLVVGATSALFTGLIAVVQTDIKRVVAYSTLSQLGYMIAAAGASAFAAGMFQLVTHAFFKALLFLAAGSVIMGMHHEQDMRKMGGLWKYMPITWITFLIGALSLSAIPPFSGFFSKDAIIEAVGHSVIPGSSYAYYCVLIGAFVTALYIFRAFFYTFHTKERFDEHTRKHIKESPAVVWVPLVLLAIPAAILGAFMIYPALYEPNGGLLSGSIFVSSQYNVLKEMAPHYHGIVPLMLGAFKDLPFWFSIAGIVVAWVCYVAMPSLPKIFSSRFKLIYQILIRKYGFDDFNDIVFVRGARNLGSLFYRIGDVKIIDGWGVNGTGRLVRWASAVGRKMQTGYIYHYAFVMIAGLLAMMVWLLA